MALVLLGVILVANAPVTSAAPRSGMSTLPAPALQARTRAAPLTGQRLAARMLGQVTPPRRTGRVAPLLGQPASAVGTGGIGAATTLGASWSITASLPTPRAGAQTLTDPAGDIFVIGGQTGDGSVSSVVEVYTVVTTTADGPQYAWLCSFGDTNCPLAYQVLPPLPTARTEMAGATLNVSWRDQQGQQHTDPLLFLMGGADAYGNALSSVEVFDVGQLRWYCSVYDTLCPAAAQVLSPLPTARVYAAATTGADNRIYVMGGTDRLNTGGSYTLYNIVEAYNFNANAWSCSTGDGACAPISRTLRPLPDYRYGMPAVSAANGSIYVMGGDDTSGQPTHTTYAYDVYANTWSGAAAMPTARSFLAAASGSDGQVYALGGWDGASAVDTVDAYDPRSNAWAAAAALPAPRANFAAVRSYSQIYAIGGVAASGSVTATNATFTPPAATIPPTTTVQEQAYPSTVLPPSQLLLTWGARYAGHPTNTIFGNYTYQHTDLQLPGYGPPVRITRTYSSLYPRDGLFGWGWNVTYGMHLAAGASTVAVTREDGRTETYTDTHQQQPETLISPPGSVDSLVQQPDGTYTLTTRAHLVYRFDGAGHLTSVADADGNTVTLSYTAGRWTGISDAGGRTWTLAYNAAGRVASVTNPAGQTTTYRYNDRGELIGVTDLAGGLTQYAYDTDGYHQLIRVSDANNHLVVANYYRGSVDPQGHWYGRVVAQDDSRGGWRYFYYARYATANVDPLGATTFTLYDAAYNPRYRIDPLGRVTAYTYTNGLLTSTADPSGGVTSYSYDGRGNISSTTDPLGNVTTMTYTVDGNDNLLSRTDARGHTTTYTYNDANHPLSMTDALGGVTRYSYDSRGLRISATDPLSGTTTFGYDSYGNRTSVTDPLGHTTTDAYDSAGRVIAQTDPLSHTTTTTYNALNLPLTVTAADGGTTTYTYDAVGNRLSATDPLSHTTHYVYNDANDQIGTLDPLGNLTVYEYDADGRQIARLLADGSIWTTTYDLAGQKVSATSALCYVTASTCGSNPIVYCRDHRADCHTTQFAYDNNGNLRATLDPAGHLRLYAYDGDNRLIGVRDPLGNMTQYTYDASGNRIAVTDALTHTTSYGYDALNRTVAITNADGQASSTIYDAVGRVTRTTNGAGQTIDNTYDAAGRLLTVTADGHTTRYTYDAAGNRGSMQDTQGATTYAYDALNRPALVDGPSGRVSYGYDLAGNRTSMTQASRGSASTAAGMTDAALPEETASGRTEAPAPHSMPAMAGGGASGVSSPAGPLAGSQAGVSSRAMRVERISPHSQGVAQSEHNAPSAVRAMGAPGAQSALSRVLLSGDGRVDAPARGARPGPAAALSQAGPAAAPAMGRQSSPLSRWIVALPVLRRRPAQAQQSLRPGFRVSFTATRRSVALSRQGPGGGRPRTTRGLRPPNDDFANALVMRTLPFTNRPGENTAGATLQRGEPRPSCAASAATVWFRVTPSRTGILTVRTAGSSYETVLAVYTGKKLGALRQVACLSIGRATRRTAGMRFAVRARTAYYLQVGSHPRRNGAVTSGTLLLSASLVTAAATRKPARRATRTPVVPASPTPVAAIRRPGATSAPQATATATPRLTATPTPLINPSNPPPATNTAVRPPAATNTAVPPPPATNTNTAVPPPASNTPAPPSPTNTPVPLPMTTNTSTATPTLIPPSATWTVTATPTASDTAMPPTAIATGTPAATSTPLPATATTTGTPTTSATPSASPTATAATPTATATGTAGMTATSLPTSMPTVTPSPSATSVLSTAATTYRYDDDNHLTEVLSGSGTAAPSSVARYQYDGVGRNRVRASGNGVTTTLTYDLEGRLTRIATGNAGGQLQQSTYTLDNLGNRTSEVSSGFGAAYGYDGLGQLVTATTTLAPYGMPVQHDSYAYTYDAVGNRTSATTDGVSTAYTYDAADQMTAAGTTAVTYDAAGRLANDGQNTYSYDAFDRLTSINGTVAASYSYDGDGNRIGETVNGARTAYLLDTASALPVRIASSGDAGLTRYVYGLQRIVDVSPDGSLNYEHADGLDSVRLRTDASGIALGGGYNWYTPTGALMQGSGAFGFTGEPYTAGGSLVYLRARDYSPALDRFLTMDPHAPDPANPATYNPYTYTGNNPVNATDHSGWLACFPIGSPGCFDGGGFSPAANFLFGGGMFGGLGGPMGYSSGSPLIDSFGPPIGSAPGDQNQFIPALMNMTNQWGAEARQYDALRPYVIQADAQRAQDTVLNIAALSNPGAAAAAQSAFNTCGSIFNLDPSTNCVLNAAGVHTTIEQVVGANSPYFDPYGGVLGSMSAAAGAMGSGSWGIGSEVPAATYYANQQNNFSILNCGLNGFNAFNGWSSPGAQC